MNPRHVANVRARISGPNPTVLSEIAGYRLTVPAKEILRWWLSVRGDKPLPSADEVDLRSLVELLPYIRYMSWEGPESLVIRVFGSALCEAAGMDLKGVDILSFIGGKTKQRDIDRLKLLPRLPCGVIVFWNVLDQNGIAHPMEMMTLPIGPGSDGKDRIIGTVMPVLKPEDVPEIWVKTMDVEKRLKFQDALFVDVGYGVP